MYKKNPLLEGKFADLFKEVELGEDLKEKDIDSTDKDIKDDKLETPVDEIIKPVDVDINDLVFKCYHEKK